VAGATGGKGGIPASPAAGMRAGRLASGRRAVGLWPLTCSGWLVLVAGERMCGQVALSLVEWGRLITKAW